MMEHDGFMIFNKEWFTKLERRITAETSVALWRHRAITEARMRVRIAKEKNRLKELNRRLMNKAYSFVTDAEGIRISYRALEADSDMIRMEFEERIAELNTAIHRLPEPPFGDGPDERVGWILEKLANYRNRKPSYSKVVQALTILEVENEELKRSVEQNLRAAQHAETSELRTEVQWFAALMEERLKANDDKGGWDATCFTSLLHRLIEEVEELKCSIIEQGQDTNVLYEAADVANFAMMIADNFKWLGLQHPRDRDRE